MYYTVVPIRTTDAPGPMGVTPPLGSAPPTSPGQQPNDQTRSGPAERHRPAGDRPGRRGRGSPSAAGSTRLGDDTRRRGSSHGRDVLLVVEHARARHLRAEPHHHAGEVQEDPQRERGGDRPKGGVVVG